MDTVLPFNKISVRPLLPDGSSGDPRSNLKIEFKEEGQASILKISDGMINLIIFISSIVFLEYVLF